MKIEIIFMDENFIEIKEELVPEAVKLKVRAMLIMGSTGSERFEEKLYIWERKLNAD